MWERCGLAWRFVIHIMRGRQRIPAAGGRIHKHSYIFRTLHCRRTLENTARSHQLFQLTRSEHRRRRLCVYILWVKSRDARARCTWCFVSGGYVWRQYTKGVETRNDYVRGRAWSRLSETRRARGTKTHVLRRRLRKSNWRRRPCCRLVLVVADVEHTGCAAGGFRVALLPATPTSVCLVGGDGGGGCFAFREPADTTRVERVVRERLLLCALDAYRQSVCCVCAGTVGGWLVGGRASLLWMTVPFEHCERASVSCACVCLFV